MNESMHSFHSTWSGWRWASEHCQWRNKHPQVCCSNSEPLCFQGSRSEATVLSALNSKTQEAALNVSPITPPPIMLRTEWHHAPDIELTQSEGSSFRPLPFQTLGWQLFLISFFNKCLCHSSVVHQNSLACCNVKLVCDHLSHSGPNVNTVMCYTCLQMISI